MKPWLLQQDLRCAAVWVSLVPPAAAKPAGPGDQGEPEVGHLLVFGSTQWSWSGADPICSWWWTIFSQPHQLPWGPIECVAGRIITLFCKNSCSSSGKPMSDLWTTSEPSSPWKYPEPWSSTRVYKGLLSQGQIPHLCWVPKSFITHPCSLHP